MPALLRTSQGAAERARTDLRKVSLVVLIAAAVLVAVAVVMSRRRE